MAEVVISVVVERIREILVQEEDPFYGLRQQVGRICTELQAIHQYLRDAEDRLHWREINTWEAEVRDLAYDAEDIFDIMISMTVQREKLICIGMIPPTVTEFVLRIEFLPKIKRINDQIRKFRKIHNISDQLPEIHNISDQLPEIRDNRERHRIKFLSNIKRIIDRIRKREIHKIRVNRERHQIDAIVEHNPDNRPRRTQPYVTEDQLYGLEDDMESLQSQLVEGDSERRVISIVGMGGLGKTTLAKAVYNSEVVVGHFHHRTWICVSQDYTERDLLNDAWASIMYSVEADTLTMEQKKGRLSLFLEQRRYLIVLDDVWNVEAWRFLEGAFPDTRNGSRVLLTTRDDSVASGVDPNSIPHRMQCLSDDSSWMLFLKAGGRKETDYPPELINIGRQIVNKCGGSPLAIKVIRGLLFNRNNTVEEWEKVLVSVSSHLQEIEQPFSRILELSYKDLTFRLRPLLLYFLVFPKEYQIPVRRLFGLWLAERIVTPQEGVSWEDLAHSYLQELIVTNMIKVVRWKLDGKPRACRMDGSVRDLFLSKLHDIGTFHIRNSNNSDNPLAQTSSTVRRLVEYTDISDYSSLEPRIQKSRCYISFNFRKGDIPAEVTGRFLARVIQKGSFALLGVLDLERVYKPKLPQSIGKLHLLKYLGLRWTFLDTLPSSVGELSYLETLDVKHTHISRLPISIWRLENLQHLYLNEIYLGMDVKDTPISRLRKFWQELDMPEGHSHINVQKLQTLLGLSIDMENPTVTSRLYGLVTLKKLGLTCQGTMDEAFVQWISRLKDIETLRLRSRDEYGQPSNLQLGSFSSLSRLSNLYLVGLLSSPLHALGLPQNLTVLTLSVSRLNEDPMSTLEQLQNLRALRLLAQSYTGREMVCSDTGFPSLCVMKLWMLEELEEWSVEEGAMVNLEELEIRCCKRLKEVPQVLLQLPSMRTLILTNMSEAFKAKVEAKKSDHLSLTVNNWDFPTFAEDQVTNLGGQSSG